MRYTLPLLLLLATPSLGAAQHIDRPLLPLMPLIDSLVVVTGGAPDTILLRPTPLNGPPNTTGFYDPQRRHMRVAPDSPNRRRTLMHEFGHLLQDGNPALLWAWVDLEVGNGAMPTRDDLEQFANDFRDAFDALSHHTLPRKSGALLIATAIAPQLATLPAN
jgi:hypothetical protein